MSEGFKAGPKGAGKGGQVQGLGIGRNRAGGSAVLGPWARMLDRTLGRLAVDDPGTGSQCHPQTLRADGHATVGADFDGRAYAPDVRPPGTAWPRAQNAALLTLRLPDRHLGRAARFAVYFAGVAMTAQLGQAHVGAFGRGDGFSREAGEQSSRKSSKG